ncbi:MAG: response regulator transcription factor [Candidatus Omnitrophica bacterium]|nr:response regulator transcription factor [Candidatus Omnitrophota bacterium]MDD4013852.1 response regulator transcription factor [Candidatus Omnitrophota bacterium]
MSKEKILLVEDDKNLSKLVRYNLEKSGFTVFAAETGEKALEYLKKTVPDAVILDIMLPEIDGFEVCRRIRQTEGTSGVPVIMLTAKGEEIDRVLGLELGADDYVVKPFSPRELILRIKAILRRGRPEDVPDGEKVIKAGNISVDIAKHKVTADKKEIGLTLMEFNLLVTLLERRGRVQSRERLLSDVWSIESDVTTRTIDTHVKRLRQKLGKPGKFIETVRGIGYKFSEGPK